MYIGLKPAPDTFREQVINKLLVCDIFVTDHAIRGMWNRQIDPDYVAETYLTPEFIERDSYATIYMRAFGTRTIRVVVNHGNYTNSLISVSWYGWRFVDNGKFER